ncbi:MAG: helix-hairpin-helix domain-containing protein [Planctomycetota bacterium]|jgi:DNA uptake protein ComE-like DNA-binding protein
MLKMETADKKLSRKALPAGSALILTVVLTSLLAIIGVLFVLVSRVDKMATSSVSENKELNLAVETVVAKISRELIFDVPGAGGREYYDYPDVNDIWLASLEPYRDGVDYKWRQISDLYAKLDPNMVVLQAEVVPDYQDAALVAEGLAADADGDGVVDSRWVIIPEISSGKGKPIYAAVRIIDNGAMLNANTAFKFDPTDPNSTIFQIGGSSQLQIDLLALADRPGELPDRADETALLTARANPKYGLYPNNLAAYARNVIWRYGAPNGPYTPFDISDELEFRNRFLLNHRDIDTRLEQWGGNFRTNTLSTPVISGGGPLDSWFTRISDNDGIDPNYAYRHITTTYNMDRIIDPNGQKMVNVNTADVNELYTAILKGFMGNNPNAFVAVSRAAQLAVNIADLRDADAQVSVLQAGPAKYYGFEAQPFITELDFKISGTSADVPANNHFAIELYNPFDADIPLGDFRLEVRDPNGAVVGTIDLTDHGIPDGSRFVITNNSAASGTFGVTGMMSTGGGREDTNLVLAKYESVQGSDPPEYVLTEWYDVYLIRRTRTGDDIYLDRQKTKREWFEWDTFKDAPQYYARAENNWNVVYQDVVPASNTLGEANDLPGGRKNYNFYNFANAYERFVTVGDITRAFIVGPGADPNNMIGKKLEQEPAEDTIRLNLQNPAYANIFQYLTVIDPTENIDPNDYTTNYQSFLNETRIKGRININTSPWFVIAKLPWMRPAIAQSIVAYRDTISGAFESIGELVQVRAMGYYAYDPNYATVDLNSFPDLTPSDGAISDFEERDVIFSRISNIVTVRSDVFTAYILVRIGPDGPQKRVLAILDRSQATSPGGKVRILAMHPVPDPR